MRKKKEKNHKIKETKKKKIRKKEKYRREEDKKRGEGRGRARGSQREGRREQGEGKEREGEKKQKCPFCGRCSYPSPHQCFFPMSNLDDRGNYKTNYPWQVLELRVAIPKLLKMSVTGQKSMWQI